MLSTTTKAIKLVMHLRKMGITDTCVLSALERVPRDLFVPNSQKHDAWEDIALPIGQGQTISQPYVVALMTQALELTDMDKVLEIGTGCGYQAAVLSKIARRVYTIERHKPLLDEAEKRFDQLGIRNITAICADGMQGWPKMGGLEQAPFDKIIVTAAARTAPPDALMTQLKEGGIMVIPVGEPGNQMLRKYERLSDENWAVSDLCPVRFVPLLPEVADQNGAAA